MCEMVTEFNQESPLERNYLTKQFLLFQQDIDKCIYCLFLK